MPEDGTYSGRAQVHFSDPDGVIAGIGNVTISPDGHVSVRIAVEEYEIPPEYHGMLLPFVDGTPGTTMDKGTCFHIGGAGKRASFEVSTASGRFSADRALVGATQLMLGDDGGGWFELVPAAAEFVVQSVDDDDMWCAPLVGDLAEFERCSTASLIPGRIPYIHFTASGHSCGIHIFPAKDVPNDGCAGVVFGPLGVRPHQTPQEIAALLPTGLHAALDFLSGSDVRTPWVEVRSREGELKTRFHIRFGGYQQETGFPALSKFDSSPGSGIAEFLRVFFSLPAAQRRSFTPTLSLIRRGAPGSATVDESITNLIKALDATCKRLGFGRVNLMNALEDSTSAELKSVLADAKERLKKIRRQCRDSGKLDQLGIIDRIISRHANTATDELDFGIAVSELLRSLSLSDGEVMNQYYSSLPTSRTWEGLLSFIRGEVVHSGAIHVNDQDEVLAWFELARHLHDICKRVVFREVGYQGTYSASNVLFKGTYALDRIKPTMSVADLGYTIPPPTF